VNQEVVRWGNTVTLGDVRGRSCRNFNPRLRHLGELSVDARPFADRDYLVQGERRLTFGAYETAVARVADLLVRHGVTPDDRVLILGANSLEWVVSWWSIVRIGAVAVLGNMWWSPEELAHAIRMAAPVLVLADADHAKVVPPGQSVIQLEELGELIKRPPSQANRKWPERDEDDPAVIIFTSGTTGLPKGVVLSHRSLLATMHATLERTHRLPVLGTSASRATKSLISLPLFHVGGLQQILIPMATGGTLIFNEGRFDPAKITDLIRNEDLDIWSTVPTMVTRVLDYLDDRELEPLASVRTIGLGGAPVAQRLRARIPQHFPSVARRLAVAYGLSEAGGSVTSAVGDAILSRPGTVGLPYATAEIQILEPDESGTGEVLLRGPFVMLGYMKTPGDGIALDSQTITEDGWLHTGDVGHIDSDGYLFITDRIKDIVIRGGENIGTPHVEDNLLHHPDVREVAVFGLPHPIFGEELAAVVVLRPGSNVNSHELREFLTSRLAYFEIPTKWDLRFEPLPHNVTGKILKKELRDHWPNAREVPRNDR